MNGLLQKRGSSIYEMCILSLKNGNSEYIYLDIIGRKPLICSMK